MNVYKSLLVLLVCLTFQGTSHADTPWANSKKRGVGVSLNPKFRKENLKRTRELKAAWISSWSKDPVSVIDESQGLNLVPMAWGRNAANTKAKDWIEGQQSGVYRELLGFNEPDSDSQANMTVAEALELWPKLEATGLRLGSPAAAQTNGEWMKEFMAGVEEKGLRVDFMAVHRYGGADPESFLKFLKETHEKYKRPIWITEFAVADWKAKKSGKSRYSNEKVYKFMETVLPQLEQLDYVERYAWFSASREKPALAHSALFDGNGSLTRLGKLYQGHPTPMANQNSSNAGPVPGIANQATQTVK